MVNLIKIKECLHICYYSTPIASKYVSFNTRDIVYECRCGKRKIKRFDSIMNIPFPIETNFLMTRAELEKIANTKQLKKIK